MANLPPLPDDLILCTTDFSNILHEEGLIATRKALDTRKDQTISADSLIHLAECVLNNNIFDSISISNSIFKDTHRENTPLNKTEALPKSMNMYIWATGTLNQLFITGSYTYSKFSKLK